MGKDSKLIEKFVLGDENVQIYVVEMFSVLCKYIKNIEFYILSE